MNSVLSYIMIKNNYFLSQIYLKGKNFDKFNYFLNNIGDAEKLVLGPGIQEDIFNIMNFNYHSSFNFLNANNK